MDNFDNTNISELKLDEPNIYNTFMNFGNTNVSEELKLDEPNIYKDIEDDLMHGEFESEQEQIEYLQGIIDFCQEQIASLS